MKYIEGDILDVQKGYIFHQVNCQGVMGAGLAKQIRIKWPSVYTDYIEAIKRHDDRKILLGTFLPVKVSENVTVVNVFSQLGYGNRLRHTDYDALALALSRFKNSEPYADLLYFPYAMGCGLGGGNWKVVSAIINTIFDSKATIVQLKN